ncbi:MAG: hypothetical protein RLZ12_596 [Bacillota bacterium]|jgi:tRNA dimethylallyltransferase
MNDVVAIVGPTGVGKSDIAIKLANKLRIEIISVDAFQVYRGLNIGTAKVSLAEQSRAPHHLLDIVSFRTSFSVKSFQCLAQKKLNEIWERGNLPVVVGGTGLYLSALLCRYKTPAVPPDKAFRATLAQEIAEYGSETLHERLRAVDPVAAESIHPANHRRLIRALEVTKSGHKFSEIGIVNEGSYGLWIGLNMPRPLLYERINKRVVQMIEQGLLNEVKSLVKQGLTKEMTAGQAIGYKELLAYLAGDCDFMSAIEEIKCASRKYAKRQLSWFRRLAFIKWFDVSRSSSENEIVSLLLQEFPDYVIESSP